MTLRRIAKAHDCLEMWLGSQNLPATKNKSCAQFTQNSAIRYISHTEEIVNVSHSNVPHNGQAAVKLSERTHGSPTLVAKDLAGELIKILNVRRIKRINRHPGNRNEDIGLENIWDAEYWVDRNGDLDYLTDSEDDWEVENKSEIVLDTSVRDS
jgi:hypothetical protein